MVYLEGITRGEAIRLARRAGYRVHEGRYSLQDLKKADEIFLTSTTLEIVPVTRVYGPFKILWHGRSLGGPITRPIFINVFRLCYNPRHFFSIKDFFMAESKKLKLGVPKGSLQESTIEIFKRAGIRVHASERSYFPGCDDDELDIMLVRSQEMARYVADGVFDAGLTGYDWVMESGAKVHEICELMYAKTGFRPVRWVLAVPNDSPIKSVKDLEGKAHRDGTRRRREEIPGEK